MMMSLERKLDGVDLEGTVATVERNMVYVSRDAEKTLASIHKSLATLNRAPVCTVAAEASRYGLWTHDGMTKEEIEVFLGRLRVLSRVDRATTSDASQFVHMVRSPTAVIVEPSSSVRRENAESWAKFQKKLLEAKYLQVVPADFEKNSLYIPSEKRRSSPPVRFERSWEVRRRERQRENDWYYEERKRVVRENEEKKRARTFDALASARRCLEPLTEEENERVEEAFHRRDRDLIMDHFNIEIFGEHVRRLRPRQWLVDELINFYFQLLQQRDKAILEKKGNNDLSSHFFNSFFFVKLLGDDQRSYNYAGVRRWTKRFDIFQKKYVCIPVNLGNMHWTLIVIDVQHKVIRYFDSMNGQGYDYLNATLRYLKDEHVDKKKTPLDTDGWTLLPTTPDTPQQQNGYDCGVFATFFAHFMSLDGTEPDFDQSNINLLRRRLLLSILDKNVPY